MRQRVKSFAPFLLAFFHRWIQTKTNMSTRMPECTHTRAHVCTRAHTQIHTNTYRQLHTHHLDVYNKKRSFCFLFQVNSTEVNCIEPVVPCWLVLRAEQTARHIASRECDVTWEMSHQCTLRNNLSLGGAGGRWAGRPGGRLGF